MVALAVAVIVGGEADGQDTRRSLPPVTIRFDGPSSRADSRPSTIGTSASATSSRPASICWKSLSASDAATLAAELATLSAADDADALALSEGFGSEELAILLSTIRSDARLLRKYHRDILNVVRPWHLPLVRATYDTKKPELTELWAEVVGQIARLDSSGDATLARQLLDRTTVPIGTGVSAHELIAACANATGTLLKETWFYRSPLPAWIVRAVDRCVTNPETRRQAFADIDAAVASSARAETQEWNWHVRRKCMLELARAGSRPLASQYKAVGARFADACDNIATGRQQIPIDVRPLLVTDSEAVLGAALVNPEGLICEWEAASASWGPDSWKAALQVLSDAATESSPALGWTFPAAIVRKASTLAVESTSCPPIDALKFLVAVPHCLLRSSLVRGFERLDEGTDLDSASSHEIRWAAALAEVNRIDCSRWLRRLTEAAAPDIRTSALYCLAVTGARLEVTEVIALATLGRTELADSEAANAIAVALSHAAPPSIARIKEPCLNTKDSTCRAIMLAALAEMQGVSAEGVLLCRTANGDIPDDLMNAIMSNDALRFATQRLRSIGLTRPPRFAMRSSPAELRNALSDRLRSGAYDPWRRDCVAQLATLGVAAPKAEMWQYLIQGRTAAIDEWELVELSMGWDPSVVAWWLTAMRWNERLVMAGGGFFERAFEGVHLREWYRGMSATTIGDVIDAHLHAVSPKWTESRIARRFFPVAE